VVYLLIGGNYVKALVLFLYSALLISQIDSIIRPFFISGRTEIHNLFIFFSILGGLKVFGFLGLFLGPILVALSLSIIDIYRSKILGERTHAGTAGSGDH
jgi:predicted PurR-regulated permease PerM